MKIVISTQVFENYAAHDWNGEGDCPQYWKPKFGHTYIVSDIDISKATDSSFWDKIYDLVEVRDNYFQEFIIDSDLVDDVDFDKSNYCEDWEDPIEITAEMYADE